jgi:hypothetical protein
MKVRPDIDHSPMNPRRLPDPVLLVVAIFSRHDEALQWGQSKLEGLYGPVGLASPDFLFNQTQYYQAAMGTGLKKRFLAFAELVSSDDLSAVKVRTNELEAELAQSAAFPDIRPLNLDPGLLSLGKFLLATTKDQAHRIYLRDGIYAEVTLRFQASNFEPWPWTYADYRQPMVLAFFNQARDYYRRRLREQGKEREADIEDPRSRIKD